MIRERQKRSHLSTIEVLVEEGRSTEVDVTETGIAVVDGKVVEVSDSGEAALLVSTAAEVTVALLDSTAVELTEPSVLSF